MMSSLFRSRMPRALRRSSQRGVTLLFALITLVALLLATLALVRSVDTSSVLMGNIGFKQDATATADQATKVALNWLSTNGTLLNSDSLASGSGQGYYASNKEYDSSNNWLDNPVDVTGSQVSVATGYTATEVSNRQNVDWTNDSCSKTAGTLCSVAVPAANLTGSNSARYIIFRLCSQPGDYTGVSAAYTGTCAKWTTTNITAGTDGARGGCNYSNLGNCSALNTTASPYYRIVVRVQGARNTNSYTETIVHY